MIEQLEDVVRETTGDDGVICMSAYSKTNIGLWAIDTLVHDIHATTAERVDVRLTDMRGLRRVVEIVYYDSVYAI